MTTSEKFSSEKKDDAIIKTFLKLLGIDQIQNSNLIKYGKLMSEIGK